MLKCEAYHITIGVEVYSEVFCDICSLIRRLPVPQG